MTKITIADHYPAKLKKELTRFNADVDALQAARVAIDSDRAALIQAATAGTLKNPARLLDDAQALRARAVACDHTELALLNQKRGFQADIGAARNEERDRVMALANQRRDTVMEKLREITPHTKYAQGVVGDDCEWNELNRLAEALRQPVSVTTDEEKRRAAELSAALARLLQ